MSRIKIKITRVLAGLLIIALFAAMLAALPTGGKAEAAASLPYIEKLRTQLTAGAERTFRVLEIVPDTDGIPTIGYYMAGNEPGNLSSNTALRETPNVDARKAYVNSTVLPEIRSTVDTLFGTGAYGASDSFPFDITNYDEAFYWQPAASHPYILTLKDYETAQNVNGIITPADNGAYQTAYAYTITPGNFELDGGYLRRVTTSSAGSGTHYYYSGDGLIFEKLTPGSNNFDDGTPIPDGSAIYTLSGGTYTFFAYKTPGALDPDPSNPSSYGDFYAVKNMGATAPDSTDFSSLSGEIYELVNAKVIETGLGNYLARTLQHLTLVGSGGDCNFTANTAGTPHTIHYNKVRYSGGFENRNWFSRFVLDADATDIPNIEYSVTTKPVSEVGSTIIKGMFDLIVVVGTNFDGNALPDNAAGAINPADGGDVVPALFISATAGLLGQFGVTAENSTNNGNFVKGSMYFYKPSGANTAPGYSGFITKDFNTDFQNNTEAMKGLAAVRDDINSENALRAIIDEERLPVRVSMATAVRYILNQCDPRAVQPLTHIRVLEIQPYNDAGIDATERTAANGARELGTTGAGNLNVLNWLQGLQILDKYNNMTGVTADNVTITRMSTKEFNGKIENLNENYELIYIGDSLRHFATTVSGSSRTTTFKDSAMNGLIYFNIGDTDTREENRLSAGLLGSDWTGAIDSSSIQQAATTVRLSGNDISLRKMQELDDFVNAGYPVVFGTDLLDTVNSELDGVTYNVALSASGAYPDFTLTASAVYTGSTGTQYTTLADLRTAVGAPASAQGQYEWHRISNGIDTVVFTSANTDAASATFNVNAGDAFGEYYCVYRIVDGASPLGAGAKGNTISIAKTKTYLEVVGNITATDPAKDSSGNIEVSVITTASPTAKTDNPITLTAAVIASDISNGNNITDNFNFTYQWHSSDSITSTAISGATSRTYQVLNTEANEGYYYCVVTATDKSSSLTVSVTCNSINIAADTQIASTIPIPGDPKKGVIAAYAPKINRVDKWSHLYEFMLKALSKDNAFNNDDLTGPDSAKLEFRASLRSFISLSKPAIVLSEFPDKYVKTGDGMTANASGSQLNYSFTISDPADPTPASTTYNIKLYVDSNASGLYTNDESVNVDVYTSDNRLVAPSMSGGAAAYSLKAGTAYHLRTKLPDDMVGIIPWKLEVIKNSSVGEASYFHGSQIGYTRIAPVGGQKTAINILQIYPLDETDKVAIIENAQYTTHLNVADFEINLNIINTNGSVYKDTLKPDTLNGRARLWAADASQEEIFRELSLYDMLILGFADCYGELTDAAANAVRDYIETGRAVLFTHDTTSFLNVPAGTQRHDGQHSYNGHTHWGYSFNKILRKAVGLDYYGILDPEFPFLRTSTASLTPTQINNLKSAGYNIAYTPKSADVKTEYMTQGFTDYHIKSGVSNQETTSVTQINAGQITTYPHDINLKGFQESVRTATALSVSNTHQQYYSLNMNHDDLVVWFALNGTSYSYNDASDGYYIYTMGNVTYSGVGHSADVTEDEAKLFVNTMIAAYRSSSLTPEVTIRDKNNTEIEYIYFPSDVEGKNVTVSNNAHDEMFAAYFSFIDANIKGGAAGVSTARYYYSTPADNHTARIEIKAANGIASAQTYSGIGDANPVSSILRSTLYHFYIPADVVRKLDNSESVRIYVEVTTDFGPDGIGIGYDTLELRKIGLLGLK